MINAELDDLRIELWLRTRNSGELAWTTKDGEIIPIKDMSTQHLVNTINYLEKKDDERDKYLEGLGSDCKV